MKILWIFFGVITKLHYIKGSFLCILGSFSLSLVVAIWCHENLNGLRCILRKGVCIRCAH